MTGCLLSRCLVNAPVKKTMDILLKSGELKLNKSIKPILCG